MLGAAFSFIRLGGPQMTIEQRIDRIEYLYLKMLQMSHSNQEQAEAYEYRINRHKVRLIMAIAFKESNYARQAD
jgi:hypothetical protein